jgi:hypothetical protein
MTDFVIFSAKVLLWLLAIPVLILLIAYMGIFGFVFFVLFLIMALGMLA